MDEYVMYFLRIFENDNDTYYDNDYINENVQNDEIIRNINYMINGILTPENDVDINEIISIIVNDIIVEEQQIEVLTPEEFDILKNKKYSNDDKYSNCDICLDEFKIDEIVKRTPCDHMYHSECLKKWICDKSSNCPSCRYDIKKYLLLNRNEHGRNI